MTLPLPPELPMLPAPRARALVLLMNPDAPIEGYVAIVEGDPGLTVSVLRAANSVASWPLHPVRSAHEAVVRLGTTQIRQIVTAAVLRSEFDRVDAAGIDADEMWRHLLGCAVLCEAGTPAGSRPESAFLAGLLHNIGRLAMAVQAPSRYRQVVDAVQEGGGPVPAERALFGIDHAVFGARICQKWQLPPEVISSVEAHHGAPVPEPSPLTPILREARSIVAGLGIGDGIHRPDARDPQVEAHPLLLEVGGREGLMGEIRWFREATTARTGLPARRRAG